MKDKIVRATENSWTVRIELPPSLNGRRRQKRITIKGTRRDAQRAIDAYRASLTRGESGDPGRLKVTDLLERWLQNRRTRIARSTFSRYEAITHQHIIPVIGNVRLKALTAATIDQALDEWKKTPRRDRKRGALAQRTVHHIYSTLSTALNAAVRWKLLNSNPCLELDPVPKGDNEVLGLHNKDIPALFAGLRETVVFVPALLAAFAGLRRGEILGLHWHDINLASGATKVVHSLDDDKIAGLTLKEPKTRRSRRTVALPTFVLLELREHHTEVKMHFGADRIPPMVFPDWETGNYWKPDELSSAFYYLVRSRHLPKVSLHGLRHTFSNIMQSTGASLMVLSRALGHTDISTTANIYVDVPAPELIEAASRLDDAFRSVM